MSDSEPKNLIEEPYTVVTLKDVYKLVVTVRDLVLEQRERTKSLTFQVKTLWAANAVITGAFITAAIKAFGH